MKWVRSGIWGSEIIFPVMVPLISANISMCVCVHVYVCIIYVWYMFVRVSILSRISLSWLPLVTNPHFPFVLRQIIRCVTILCGLPHQPIIQINRPVTNKLNSLAYQFTQHQLFPPYNLSALNYIVNIEIWFNLAYHINLTIVTCLVIPSWSYWFFQFKFIHLWSIVQYVYFAKTNFIHHFFLETGKKN